MRAECEISMFRTISPATDSPSVVHLHYLVLAKRSCSRIRSRGVRMTMTEKRAQMPRVQALTISIVKVYIFDV